MKVIVIFFAVFLLVFSAGCGSKSLPNPTQTPTPTPQIQTSTFAFMQSVAGQAGLYSPMIGTFVTTGAVCQFSSAGVVEAATNQVVTGDFYSIALSAYGKKVAVDLSAASIEILGDRISGSPTSMAAL